uniref:Uncharacterized protein n=1 Tax=Onchocerca volvulus TaxID=6282 RepID=A0A8R1XM47_ONCVO
MVYPLERRPREEFGEEIQERIYMALGLTIYTEILSVTTMTTTGSAFVSANKDESKHFFEKKVRNFKVKIDKLNK